MQHIGLETTKEVCVVFTFSAQLLLPRSVLPHRQKMVVWLYATRRCSSVAARQCRALSSLFCQRVSVQVHPSTTPAPQRPQRALLPLLCATLSVRPNPRQLDPPCGARAGSPRRRGRKTPRAATEWSLPQTSLRQRLLATRSTLRTPRSCHCEQRSARQCTQRCLAPMVIVPPPAAPCSKVEEWWWGRDARSEQLDLARCLRRNVGNVLCVSE
jgi:hypothetical protein